MDILYDVQTITIADPSTIEEIGISIDRGAQGERGSKLYVNFGHPTNWTSQINGKNYMYSDLNEEILVNDVYWRTDASRAYQFRAQPGGAAWVEITGTSVATATGEIDFTAAIYQKINVTEDVFMTTAGLSAGMSVEILMVNATESTRSITYPDNWMWVTYIPHEIDSNQRFLIKLRSFGNTDEDVVASATDGAYLFPGEIDSTPV